MKRMFAFLFSIIVGICAAQAAPPIEVYGQLPTTRSVDISPDGSKIGFISTRDNDQVFMVFDYATLKATSGVNIGDTKARSAYFASSDYAILSASKTTSMQGFRGRFEYSAAFSVPLVEKPRPRQLLRNAKKLYPAQSGLGRIVGIAADEKRVFMPAYVGSGGGNPSYDLLSVNLSSGRESILRRGTSHTFDWFVDRRGVVLAREDFDDKRGIYSIQAKQGDQLVKIYESKDVITPDVFVNALHPDRKSLLISRSREDRTVLTRLQFDGQITGDVFARTDKDIGGVLRDRNRFLIGVEYAGLFPEYDFFDPALKAAVQDAQAHFPGAAVRLISWSDDFKLLAFHVSGGSGRPRFYIADRRADKFLMIAEEYKGISDADLGNVLTINYKARDGEMIPAVVTQPVGYIQGKKYPTIILPHGGPVAYDAVGFDWMAQYFASRGYMVLQPNFRGSAGFGDAHLEAGYGEWGRGVMQHDVTDGFHALVKAGWVDPDRTCIVGGSYGGYAALAGGAFTPDLYACVAAIAPVSDLPLMLFDEKRDSSSNWAYNVWTRRIGDLKNERKKLKSISPINYAADFKAPVLLIHGADDTVVKMRQSTRMKGALERAGKDVEFVRMRGADHWLTQSETRLETLKALDAFVEQHIGDE